MCGDDSASSMKKGLTGASATFVSRNRTARSVKRRSTSSSLKPGAIHPRRGLPSSPFDRS
ncbi:MAG: hypothetical protein MZV63_58930 [Marinilabiliales bacterium]|nr:hypothetical protein [Marinilabiliales bacterium]